MNGQTKHILFALLLALSLFSNAQKNDINKTLESIIEGLVENLEEDISSSLIVEDLEELAENPININATSASQLSKLHVLNDIQIYNLLEYINKFGPAYSIYELIVIEGLTKDLLTAIEPFIRFGAKESPSYNSKQILKYAKHQLITRGLGVTRKAQGYLPNQNGVIPYQGNRFRYYTRYRFEASDNISAGFTAEKDPGEAFFKESNKKGFDFYSGHLSFNVNQTIQNITVGDFIARAGQGLVLWQEYAFGKSDNVLNILKTNNGIRPYTSVDENLFFRGNCDFIKIRKYKAESLLFSK